MSELNKSLEVEARSFISEDEYNRLLGFLKKKATFLGKENQITYYFSGSQDLRIQKTENHAKLWLKGGNIHEKYREDIVIKFNRNDFDKLEDLLLRMGFKVEIKWFRTRNDFFWDKIKVSMDYTKGYGYIIELERFAFEKDKKEVYDVLLKKMKELEVKVTPKSVFDKKFNYYKNNWKKLI